MAILGMNGTGLSGSLTYSSKASLMTSVGGSKLILPRGWKYLRLYSWLFKVILTWNTDLCKRNRKFMHYHFPVNVNKSKYAEYCARPKRSLCLMMHSNKWSEAPGELYSLRREIISYFTDRGNRLLDLYGYGWNTERPPTQG